MRIQWMVWILLYGVAYASGSSCDVEEVTDCYEDLVHYESLSFPLYGHNDARLDETCRNIETSFNCIRSYAETCLESPDCGDECKDIIHNIRIFLSNSGLEAFAGVLCEDNSPLRETYLENVDCLEATADEYARCHNDSQKSLSYISNIQGDNIQGVEARCCYSSWYDQCFTNATRDMCGENATMFVSFAIHQLVGHMVDILCSKAHIPCDRPPLPPDEDEEENQLDKGKPDQTENEIDNEIHDEAKSKPMNTAVVQLSVTGVMIMSYIFTMLSRHIL